MKNMTERECKPTVQILISAVLQRNSPSQISSQSPDSGYPRWFQSGQTTTDINRNKQKNIRNRFAPHKTILWFSYTEWSKKEVSRFEFCDNFRNCTLILTTFFTVSTRNSLWNHTLKIVAMMSSHKTRSSAIAVIADHTAGSILTLFIVIATSRPLN